MREAANLRRQRKTAEMKSKRDFVTPGPGEYASHEAFKFTSTHGGTFPLHMRKGVVGI